MKIKERLFGKRSYELTIDELKKDSKKYRATYYLYAISALIVLFAFSLAVTPSLELLHGIQGITLYILFNLTITCVILGLIIFIWMANESSYYKMLQLHTDLMVYLKEKEEREKRSQ
jgi:TM2 domain-containing membrane protein YozV